jgi:hypothetical protein
MVREDSPDAGAYSPSLPLMCSFIVVSSLPLPDLLGQAWRALNLVRTIFLMIVKWSGLFYELRDNGPHAGTPAFLYNGPRLERPPPAGSLCGFNRLTLSRVNP